ncbi:MAG: hypothetical protein CMH64_03780 [Nanoarchaeota archaeon]|nr:hypothetical protein [Nanoarchaeota archaeon]|tara:strand:+ start:44 stop:790 length:747 start_codon:yes stop_codon:yes gene_type:complete
MLSNEIAEICGIHVGDGYLRNDGRRREWDISGNIEEKSYYNKHVIPLFNKIFDLDIKGRFFKGRNTYGFVIRKKEVIEFAHEKLQFPYGKKSTIIKIPDFIIKKKFLIPSFLRGYFDTDGHIGFTKKINNSSHFKKNKDYYPRISCATVSQELSKEISNILKCLNFNFTLYKYNPKKKTENLSYNIQISGVPNLKKWLKTVGVKNPTKNSRILIWEKFGFCPTNTTYSQRLNILKGTLNPNSLNGPVT